MHLGADYLRNMIRMNKGLGAGSEPRQKFWKSRPVSYDDRKSRYRMMRKAPNYRRLGGPPEEIVGAIVGFEAGRRFVPGWVG